MKKHLLYSLVLVWLFASCGGKQSEQPLELKIHSLEQTEPLKDGSQDSISIRIEVEYPVAMANMEALQRIQDDLKRSWFGEAFEAMDIDAAMRGFSNELVLEYRDENLPLLDNVDWFEEEEIEDMTPVLTAYHSLVSKVVSVQPRHFLAADNEEEASDVISIQTKGYAYTGGAHGLQVIYCNNYDLSTGERIGLKDVFKQGTEEKLTELICKAIAMQQEVEVEDLEKTGYWVEQIKPVENFCFSEQGITFSYSEYDIAPYSAGCTEALVRWDEIQPLLLD